ncbi:MAG: gliding motility-associated C-terminal domain-containing protein [Saprospiraceae bacterium]
MPLLCFPARILSLIITLTLAAGLTSAQCPDITVSSLASPDCYNGSTPCDLCPGDMFVLNAEGTNLPDNGCLNWYYSTNPGFNPYNGEGTLIGCGDIDSPQPPPCDVCPEILAIWIDACGNPESANEYMIIHSGSGFNVNNLGLDYDPSNNNLPPGTDDVNVNGGSCSWMVPSATVMNNMQASASCDGSNVIPAGPGTMIPPGALVVIWTSADAATPYSFENLCAAGETIYVMQSSCVRAAGAFSNSSSNGLRTTTISLNNCGCSNSITHDTDDPSLQGDGDYAYVDNGNVEYGNNGCGNPQAPDVMAPEIMAPESTVDEVSFTVTAGMCNGGPYYVVGILNPLPGGCPEEFTEEFSFNVLCPEATATFSGTPCEGNTITLMATGGGTYSWSGPGGFSSNIPNPTIGPLTGANSGTYSVTVTNESGCSDVASVDVVVFPGISATVDPALPAFCPGGSVILLATGIGGNGTYTYTWTYPGGTSNMSSVEVFQAGNYSVTVTDGNGCSIEVTGMVQEAPGPDVSINPDPAVICGGGSIDLTASAVGGSGGGYSFLWADPQGNNANGPVLNASQPGTYTVTVTDSDGCSGTAFTQLTVNANPTVMINATPPTICPGGSSLLTATGSGGAGGYTFAWLTPSGPDTGDTLTITQTGQYIVTVTDQTGCTGSDTLTVMTGQPLAISFNPDPATFCPGGTVNITVNVGGNPGNNLSYNWMTPSGGAIGNPLPASTAGTYVVTVTESGGCSGVDSVSVQELANLGISFTQDTATICPGGQAQLVGAANGGNGVYTYTWTFPGGPSFGDTLVTSTPGTYILDVVDGAGCSGQDSAVVILASTFPVTILGGGAGLCPGDSITLSTNPTPGVGWTTTWTTPSGGATAYPLIALDAGMYQVTLTDAQGCSGSAQTNIAALQAPVVAIDPASPAFCPGGSIQLTANVPTGGPIASILWNTPQGTASTQSITASQAGSYTATVINPSGCSASDTVQVAVAAGLSISFPMDTFPICVGGTIQLSPIVGGGNTPYQYAWDTPQGVSNFDTIPAFTAGTYLVTVTDANGCSGMASTELVFSNQLSVLISPDQPGFCPLDSVLLTASTSGGTGMITYIWNTPSSQVAAAQIWAKSTGVYTVFATDQSGCSGTDNTTVVGFGSPGVMIDPANPIICPGESISIVASGFGSLPPYQYAWSGPTGTATGPQINANLPGLYGVSVTDANGCFQTAFSNLTLSPPITIVIDPAMPMICSGSSTMVTATASGGSSPYLYSWSGPGLTTTTNPAIIFQAGTYTVNVVDNNGCTSSLDVVANESSALAVSIQTTTDTICNGQPYMATALVNGGTPPFNYSWSTPEGVFSAADINLMTSGLLNLTVTDIAGCSGSAQAEVIEGSFQLSFFAEDASCPGVDNGSFQVTGTGSAVPPLLLSINGDPAIPLGNLPFVASNLPPGGYTLVVTDQSGCSASNTVFINVFDEPEVRFEPDQVKVIRGDEIKLTPIFNFNPILFTWQPATDLSCSSCAMPFAGPENTTTYTLTAVDDAGCEGIGEVTVLVVGNTRIYLPRAFSPNNDGINDIFYIQSADPNVVIQELQIFDRWGNQVFFSEPGLANDPAYGWDGLFQNRPLDPAVYVYTVFVRYPDGTERLYRGDLTLVK